MKEKTVWSALEVLTVMVFDRVTNGEGKGSCRSER